MTPRRAAILGTVVSSLALGVAVAQILPVERQRLPQQPPVLSGSGVQLRQGIRDVTPGADTQPVTPPASPAPASPSSASPAPANPAPPPAAATAAPVPVPAAETRPPRPRPPPPASVDLLPDNEDLGDRVGAMRERLILAARSGDLERLKVVFETNETMPVFSRGGERDPVAFWKQASGDGDGREILAILINILDLPAARINRGTPQEMFVWPYLAHVPLDRLDARQSVDLYRLMTAQDVRDMRTLGSWVFWRLGIGPDGTLHFFLAGE
ncbi:hypothetical protein [Phreatobacter sp.]|uniref:hypothetical protein n=1 Tax=Phreatobacter sp. TaxID=1966341 RepID=UPI003F6E7339